tara:strand:- start:191 stop:682 length:492 start_codon:yes stop_codon:yes gene_type:complete
VTAPITWAEASTPITWAAVGINWNSPAKANTSTLSINGGYSNLNNSTIPASIAFANNMGKVHATTLATSGVVSFGLQNALTSAGGFTLANDISFGTTMDYTISSVLSAVSVITIPLSVTYVNATNHAESISIDSTMNVSSSNDFLWVDVSDVATTWTDVEYPN